MTNFDPHDDELLPDIIIEDDEDFDEDDEEELQEKYKELDAFIKKHAKTLKQYRNHKNKLVKELKNTIKALNLLVESKAYAQRATYSGFIRKQEQLRREVLKALLSGLDEDTQIFVLQDLLNILCGDSEPTEYYIA